jgi:hypothetical protein
MTAKLGCAFSYRYSHLTHRTPDSTRARDRILLHLKDEERIKDRKLLIDANRYPCNPL